MRRDEYRLCRMAHVESRLLRRVGVGRHEDDPGDAHPDNKRGCVYVELTDGTEHIYAYETVSTALVIFGCIMRAAHPGAEYRDVAGIKQPVDADWRWYEDEHA